MPARLRYRSGFLADVERQVAWLEAHGEIAWLDDFLAALEEANVLVSRFPEIGAVISSREQSILRVLTLPRRLPYLVYYAHRRGRPVREVDFVRLFHHAQERPEVDLAEWPW